MQQFSKALVILHFFRKFHISINIKSLSSKRKQNEIFYLLSEENPYSILEMRLFLWNVLLYKISFCRFGASEIT